MSKDHVKDRLKGKSGRGRHAVSKKKLRSKSGKGNSKGPSRGRTSKRPRTPTRKQRGTSGSPHSRGGTRYQSHSPGGRRYRWSRSPGRTWRLSNQNGGRRRTPSTPRKRHLYSNKPPSPRKPSPRDKGRKKGGLNSPRTQGNAFAALQKFTAPNGQKNVSICKYWSKGTCQRGSECSWGHPSECPNYASGKCSGPPACNRPHHPVGQTDTAPQKPVVENKPASPSAKTKPKPNPASKKGAKAAGKQGNATSLHSF